MAGSQPSNSEPSNQVRLAYRHIHPVTVVYARATGHYAASAETAWQKLNAWLADRKARRQVKRGLGLFHDNPQVTAPELLRYDACVELMAGLGPDPAAGIGCQTLGGGTHAVHTHIGGYAPMGGIFSQLHREWVPKQGLAVDYDRPFVAIYLNDPLLTREVHRRTELCIPVVPLREYLPSGSLEEGADAAAPLKRFAAGHK
jgi:AraC family transcriptional regulator